MLCAPERRKRLRTLYEHVEDPKPAALTSPEDVCHNAGLELDGDEQAQEERRRTAVARIPRLLLHMDEPRRPR